MRKESIPGRFSPRKRPGYEYKRKSQCSQRQCESTNSLAAATLHFNSGSDTRKGKQSSMIAGIVLSGQSSIWDTANETLHPFKHLTSEKRFYKRTSLITMYYIVTSQIL